VLQEWANKVTAGEECELLVVDGVDRNLIIRDKVIARLRDKQFTKEESFALLDVDKGGSIDQEEFVAGLSHIGVEVSDVEVEAIWPTFKLDEEGAITKEEWETFLDDKVGVSFRTRLEYLNNLGRSTPTVRSHCQMRPFRDTHLVLSLNRTALTD
jgi:hypothetical protein